MWKTFPSVFILREFSGWKDFSSSALLMVNLRKIKMSLWDVRAPTAFLLGCWSA